MIIRVGDRYINTQYIVTGETRKSGDKVVLTLITTLGDIQFTAREADYVCSILDTMNFTEVRTLQEQLPKTPSAEEEF